MAKKQFAQQRIGWHRDPRCLALKLPVYKWINSVIWNLAVEYQSETLPSYIDAAHIAREAACDLRTVRKCLTLMSTSMHPLLTENSDKTITVHGARAIHETLNFRWKNGISIIDAYIDVDINAASMPHQCRTDVRKIDTNIIRSNKSKVSKSKRVKKEYSTEVLTLAEYYRTFISSEKIAEGKKNLAKMLDDQDQPSFETLFKYVRNYEKVIKAEKTEKRFIIRMLNFFGEKARWEDFTEDRTTNPESPNKPIHEPGFEDDWPAC